MSKRLIVLLVIPALVLACFANGTAFARFLEQTGCSCVICPSCNHQCKFEAKKVQADKKGFDVEQKVICIPRVVFPWQKPKKSACGCDGQSSCDQCAHNGARTRKINVLKTVKYKCPECKYKWSTKEKCSCKNAICNGTCGGSGSCVRPLTPGGCAAVESESGSELKTVNHVELKNE